MYILRTWSSFFYILVTYLISCLTYFIRFIFLEHTSSNGHMNIRTLPIFLICAKHYEDECGGLNRKYKYMNLPRDDIYVYIHI